MDYIKEAKKLGFSNAAIMDTQKLVFKPEYRKFCEENQCGCYNVNPACPPECGTVESMKQRVFAYRKSAYSPDDTKQGYGLQNGEACAQ